MRRAVALAAFSCLAVAIPARGANDNVLSRETGTVTYKLPQSEPATLTGSTLVGDAVIASTDVGALAKLQLLDSSEIRIGDRTTVRIGDLATAAQSTPGGTLYLERGAVRFAIAHPSGGHANYRFVTSTSQLGVRGTVGYFVVGPAGQEIYCVQCEAGDVIVRAGTQTVAVLSGQTLDIGIQNGIVTHADIVANHEINNPAIDQFLGGVSPFGQSAVLGTDPTQSGSGVFQP